jgi:hypothetical protein
MGERMSLLRQILLGVALLAALGAYVWFTGQRIDRAEARATTAEASASAARADLAASKASEHIVTRYVDRVHTIYVHGATLTQKVPVYVTAHDDAQCTVSLGFVRLHDAAAASAALPDTAGSSDARPSDLALSAVASTVVGNYTTCHATAAQLTALQDWVRANSDGD